jgi:hypothetical protein
MVKSPRSQLKASDRKLGARLFASTLLVMGAVVSVTTGIIAEQSTPAEAATVAPATVSVQSDAGGWSNATVSAIAGTGEHSCALEEGIVYCWGRGARLYCWGADYTKPQVGLGPAGGAPYELLNTTARPVQVVSAGGFSNDGTVSAVVAGHQHTCAIEGLVPNARLYCWGVGADGRLGTGSTDDSNLAALVSPNGDFTNAGQVSFVSAGWSHTCAVESGRLFCWGANSETNSDDGRLGTGDLVSSAVAVPVTTSAGPSWNQWTFSNSAVTCRPSVRPETSIPAQLKGGVAVLLGCQRVLVSWVMKRISVANCSGQGGSCEQQSFANDGNCDFGRSCTH